MSPRRVVNPATSRRKAVDEPTLVSFLWPIVLGVLVTFVTIRLAGTLSQMGPEPYAVLYPWIALVRTPLLGIDYGSVQAIAKMLLYFQFPIYGFLGGAVLYMSNSLGKATITVISAHLFALIAYIAISIFLT